MIDRNGLSDDNEDETPSIKKKEILPNPHTPIAPATWKMTAAQKQVQENTIAAWKKAQDEAKTTAKAAEKVANEEKKKAKQKEKEKEAAKKVRADEKVIKEAKKEADMAKKKADKVKKEADKVKKEVDKAKKEADKIRENQKENLGLSKAREDLEEGVKSRNAVQASAIVDPTIIEKGGTDPLVVGRKVKGRKALLSDLRALKGGAVLMSKVSNCDPNVNAGLTIAYHSSCNLGKTQTHEQCPKRVCSLSFLSG